MNARLGIIGGLSILGTTGIVVPYSCSSWIHSIQRGIDVARAAGLDHIAAATGATSERAVQQLYDLPEHALIDMGDFVGGVLKYLRSHPVERLTLAGGFAKFAKLAARASRLAFGAQPGRYRRAGGRARRARRRPRCGASGGPGSAAPAKSSLSPEHWSRTARRRCGTAGARGGARDLERQDRGRGRDRRSQRRLSGAGRRMTARKLLILGGTAEAAALARAAAGRFGDALAVTTSLAGRTERPGPIPGEVRIGGFGGPAGLAAYLDEHRIDRLIDATHPFAARISAEARRGLRGGGGAAVDAAAPALAAASARSLDRGRRHDGGGRDRGPHRPARLADDRRRRDRAASRRSPGCAFWCGSSIRRADRCHCAFARWSSGADHSRLPTSGT